MATTSDTAALPGIAALPATTARQIGSGQVLVDPSSLVKELIDNALDARAKSIFVDITSNTIDSIQVKDDGHGIPAEDRALACRRYCTSKIRDLQDLKEVGGKWLGFRGEALASMAEMSGTLCITTRVEGEPVAVNMKYGWDGELVSTARDSHPVGTTVKATKFFEFVPVRKQTALKNSSKCLTNIRRLMQAYALARPAVRFRLHVLKAKNENGDFMYAPKSSSNFEDAVLKVIGKDCALQCDRTALETDGIEIHAFLPKPTANGTKIKNQGAFISIDSRPVSNSRGTVKQIVAAFKNRLRKSNPSFVGVKDPFFSMNIICPPDSYDPNIEPAKDEVMFDNAEVVLGAVGKLLQSYYPQDVTVEVEDVEPPTLVQEPADLADDQAPRQHRRPISVLEDSFQEAIDGVRVVLEAKEPRWRSSMYGIDEDDLEFLQENQLPVIEEEEGARAAAVSNPWTIALMNAATRPKRALGKGQLLSPAKSNAHGLASSSSPLRFETPRRPSLVEPLTPQSSSQINISQSVLDVELEQSIQHLSQTPGQELISLDSSGGLPRPAQFLGPILPPSEHGHVPSVSNAIRRLEGSMPASGSPSVMSARSSQHSDDPSRTSPATLSAPNRRQRKQQSSPSRSLLAATAAEAPDTWFGQPMEGSVPSQPVRRQQRHKGKDLLLPTGDLSSSPRRPGLAAAERMFQNRSDSENNADIRRFFGQDAHLPSKDIGGLFPRPSFTAINVPRRLNEVDNQRSHVTDHGVGSFTQSRGRSASSAEPHAPRMQLNSTNGSTRPQDIEDEFRAYAERERPYSQPISTTSSSHGLQPYYQTVRDSTYLLSDNGIDPRGRNDFQVYENGVSKSPARRSASVGSERPSVLPNRTQEVRTALDLYRQDKPSRHDRDMEAHFRAYQEREEASSQLSSSPTRRLAPRIALPHEKTSKRRRPRRRTTDGAQRTKSSKLPLERVPHDYRLQEIVLSVNWNVSSIVRSSRKLDMSRNSLEWGYPSEDAYDTFAEKVTERKIMDWVGTLEGILHEQCERLPGVDVRSLLHEAIQRGLDARREEEAVQTVELTQLLRSTVEKKMLKDADEEVLGSSQRVKIIPKRSQDVLSGFDVLQSVAIDVDRLKDAAAVSGEVVEVDDDFEDDFDDDMLMDM